MLRQKAFPILIATLFLGACGPSSLEDFHKQGEGLTESLCLELKALHSSEELKRGLPRLKKKFNDLVDLAIDARNFQEMHPNDDLNVDETIASAPDAVFLEELIRISGLEGGREMVESAQREALYKLDAFERTLSKRREKWK